MLNVSRIGGDAAAPLDGWTRGGARTHLKALARANVARAASAGWPLLVVATDRRTRKSAVVALERGGFVVHTSPPPRTCDDIERHLIALLVLDLTMPNLQGFEVLKQVHQEFEGQVPVVALTRGAEQTPAPQGWEWGLGKQGLSGYVEMPFSAERLVMVVHQVIIHGIAAREPRLCHLSGRGISLGQAKEILQSDDVRKVLSSNLPKRLRRKKKEQTPRHLSEEEVIQQAQKIALNAEAARMLIAIKEKQENQRRETPPHRPIGWFHILAVIGLVALLVISLWLLKR